MNRELGRYLIFAIVSLLAAGWASMPTKQGESGRTAVFKIESSKISEIQFVDEGVDIRLIRSEGDRWWVEIAKDGVKNRFLGSQKVKELLERFSPLEALRSIGKVEGEGLAEYGLNESKRMITVFDQSKAKVVQLTIGTQAYGSKNSFGMLEGSKEVLLISGDFIQDLEKAELRLYERMITQAEFSELQAATVVMGEKSMKYSRTKRDEKGALIWTKAEGDMSVAVSAKSWFERLEKVRVVAFATDEEIVALEKIQTLFEVKLEPAVGDADALIFKKLPRTEPVGDVTEEYFVRSSFLGVWAKVGSTRLEPLEKDIGTVLP